MVTILSKDWDNQMVLTDKTLEEILNYLDQSITKLAKDTMNSSEFHMDEGALKEFLFSQYDIRLDNLLQRKDSNIHHLELYPLLVLMNNIQSLIHKQLYGKNDLALLSKNFHMSLN